MNSKSFPRESEPLHVTTPGNSIDLRARADRMERSSLVYVPERIRVWHLSVSHLECLNYNWTYSDIKSLVDIGHHTSRIQDRNRADASCGEHLDDFKDGRIHRRSCDRIVGVIGLRIHISPYV